MANLYCMYLRKSRADLEAEARGEGETLSRHRRTLTELAIRMRLPLGEIYDEIATGESIAARPQMQRMLADIEAGLWAGVLCMDVDRLARGDSIDQGIISQTLLYSGAVVVTPGKVYDPRNESDSEFFEMKMFFSRREYAQIRKRLQAGRMRSVLDGRYMGTRPPYGYKRVKIQGDKGWTLEIVPEKAEIVRLIYEWYIHGIDGSPVGCGAIATRLNQMGLRTDMGNLFDPSCVMGIVTNPAYVGMVRWNQRTTTVTLQNGQRIKSRPKNDSPIIVRGLHAPILSQEVFDAAQERHASHYVPKTPEMLALSNPLAGLVVCHECGHTLQRKPSPRGNWIFCPTPYCKTSGILEPIFEQVVLEHLHNWITTYSGDAPAPDASPSAADAVADQLRRQRQTLQTQLSRLYDLLEQGVYSPETFVARQRELTERLSALESQLAAQKHPTPSLTDRIRQSLPRVRAVLDAYPLAATAAEKNALLKSVIEKIDYQKTKRASRWTNPLDYLQITIFPRLPAGKI